MEKEKTLYPLYFNSDFSREKGRKTPSRFSVKNPQLQDIEQILKSYNIDCRFEKKKHPADYINLQRIKFYFPEHMEFEGRKISNKKQLINLIGFQLVKMNDKKL